MEKTELMTVSKLIEELKRFEKKYSDADVVCYLPDDTICIVVTIRIDDEGDVCIRFEEGYEDSNSYCVEELLDSLSEYNRNARVYIDLGGYYATFTVYPNGEFLFYHEDEKWVYCDCEIIEEYEEQEDCSGRHSPAVRRMLAEKARKEKRQHKIEYGVLLALTVLIVCAFFYNVWAAVTLSGDALWKNILWAVTCLFCFIISSLTLYYDENK